MLSLWAAKMVVGPLDSEVWRRRIKNIYFISLTIEDCPYSQDDIENLSKVCYILEGRSSKNPIVNSNRKS